MSDLFAPLGFGPPPLLSVATLARLLCCDPALLTPGRLSPARANALGLAGMILRGEIAPDGDLPAMIAARALVERIDEGDYSLGELTRRLPTWGIGPADDWAADRHLHGAWEVHARGGWAEVRRWARGVCA